MTDNQETISRDAVGNESANKQAKLISYLEMKLCHQDHHRFIRVGPTTFYHQDKRDIVFVKVCASMVIIAHDGENVIGSVTRISLPVEFYDDILQAIVGKF